MRLHLIQYTAVAAMLLNFFLIGVNGVMLSHNRDLLAELERVIKICSVPTIGVRFQDGR